jgi:glycosyltransferase involved in cell wall biosynthesis
MAEPFRVLQVHNKYRPGWGGEDTVVELEADLLRRHGHKVDCVSAWTGELNGASVVRLVAAGFGTVWSFRGYSAVKKAIKRHSPDILHVHNTFPLLSPSIFWAAASERVPVVQTLHNFRLTCANALLLKEDAPCQKCVGHFPWPALRYRCYRQSFWQTAAVTSKNVVHRWLGTFQTKVHAHIVLTDFSKEIMVRSGLPDERIFVKPNFNPDPGDPVAPRLRRVVFAGMISRPKGVHLLLEAWASLAPAGYQLMMLGDGPDRVELERRHSGNSSIIWSGTQSRDKVIEIVGASRWLVLPSLAYENFPMAVLEAFSVGTPVVVPDHGAFAASVSNKKEGLLFSAGDAASLAVTLRDALNATESDWTQWSSNARNKYLREYTDRANYSQLMSIYQQAAECFEATRGPASRTSSSKSLASVAEPQRRDL